MKRDNKKALYESIMTSVAREVKKALNENFNNRFGYGCAIYEIDPYGGASSNLERHFKTKEQAVSFARRYLKTNPKAQVNDTVAQCFTYSLDEEPEMAYDALNDREFKTYNAIDDEWEYIVANIPSNKNFKKFDEIIEN